MLTINNVNPSHREKALLYEPCNPSSNYHKLTCGHTVLTGGTPCGTNCSRSSISPPFLCWSCVIHAQDMGFNDETCSTDLRFELQELGRDDREVIQCVVDEMLRQGVRDSGLAKADTWLEDFFTACSDAWQEAREAEPKRQRRGEQRGWQVREARHVLERAGARSWFERAP